MIIMGVDPGTARVGWGVIEEIKGKITAIAYGCITTSATQKPDQRLLTVHISFLKLLKKYKPDSVSVEDLFFSSNAKTAITVGQARGVILLTAAMQKISVISYGPGTVKKTITGNGAAQKDQIGKMVTMLLRLKKIPTPDDVGDALAIALTHGYSYKLKLHTRSTSSRTPIRYP